LFYLHFVTFFLSFLSCLVHHYSVYNTE
jgi:hypothetical protein